LRSLPKPLNGADSHRVRDLSRLRQGLHHLEPALAKPRNEVPFDTPPLRRRRRLIEEKETALRRQQPPNNSELPPRIQPEHVHVHREDEIEATVDITVTQVAQRPLDDLDRPSFDALAIPLTSRTNSTSRPVEPDQSRGGLLLGQPPQCDAAS